MESNNVKTVQCVLWCDNIKCDDTFNICSYINKY